MGEYSKCQDYLYPLCWPLWQLFVPIPISQLTNLHLLCTSHQHVHLTLLISEPQYSVPTYPYWTIPSLLSLFIDLVPFCHNHWTNFWLSTGSLMSQSVFFHSIHYSYTIHNLTEFRFFFSIVSYNPHIHLFFEQICLRHSFQVPCIVLSAGMWLRKKPDRMSAFMKFTI